MLNCLWESVHRCTVGCTFQTGLHNSDLELGDVVAVSFDLPGWTVKLMRIIRIEDAEDGRVSIACIEYDEAVYDTSDDI